MEDPDNTQLFAVNTENCPTTIEYEYYIPDLPDGFEMAEHDSSPSSVYIKYKNSSGQVIVLSQYTKKKFAVHYDTEHQDFEEIEVNGHNGLCLDLSDDDSVGSIVVRDNDDYILELFGHFYKESFLTLAKSAKIFEK